MHFYGQNFIQEIVQNIGKMQTGYNIDTSSAMDNVDCSKDLEPFEFKAISMGNMGKYLTDNCPFSNVKSENEATLDQPEVYLEENKEHLRTLLENERICQLCKHIRTHVKDLKSDLAFSLNIPEVNFGSNNEPVVCSSCLDPLNTPESFLNNSSAVQDKITKTEDSEGRSNIKIEMIEIKPEAHGNTHDELNEKETSEKREVPNDFVPNELKPMQDDGSEAQKYHCGICSYKTKYKSHFDCHLLKHKPVSEVKMYKCEICGFQTKYKRYLARHNLTHKTNDQVQMYDCTECPFTTKYKKSLLEHQLKHKDISEVQMYSCGTCNYTTKFKKYLAQHQLKHKNIADVRSYKCHACGFKTKYRTSLADHKLSHMDNSKVQMYNCAACSYETMYKQRLKQHELRHKDISEVRVYWCDTCCFETKRKNALDRHRLTHKDVSEKRLGE